MLVLADDELAALVHPESAKRVKWFASAMAKRMACGGRITTPRDFVVPVCDAEAADLFLGSKESAVATVLAWRNLANEMGCCDAPVVYRVRPGFTLLTHAPLAGPCVGFREARSWGVKDDKPTHDSVVFWVPKLIKETIGQSVVQQLAVLTQTRERLKLSERSSGLGSAALVSALMLAHYKRTREKVPAEGLSVRTDTKTGSGHRLRLRFGGDGLECSRFHKRSYENFCGCFALAVEQSIKKGG